MFGPETKRRHPERVRGFVDGFASFDPRAAATTTRSVTTRFPGLADVLPRLRVPTTILLGADDRLYTVERMDNRTWQSVEDSFCVDSAVFRSSDCESR